MNQIAVVDEPDELAVTQPARPREAELALLREAAPVAGGGHSPYRGNGAFPGAQVKLRQVLALLSRGDQGDAAVELIDDVEDCRFLLLRRDMSSEPPACQAYMATSWPLKTTLPSLGLIWPVW